MYTEQYRLDLSTYYHVPLLRFLGIKILYGAVKPMGANTVLLKNKKAVQNINKYS